MTPLTARGEQMHNNPRPRTAPSLGGGETEATMVKLLALLIAITMSCGVAAAVTISLAPPSAERIVAGY